MSKLLSVANACERLGIGRSTFYEIVGRGEIVILKIGSRTLITEAEMDRFLAAAAEVAKARRSHSGRAA